MYSVIIQNEATMEACSHHLSLFSELISSGRMGMCRWIESGSTVETALPDLSNLTDDKEEWRAVIVRYIDGNSMAACEADTRNPYDFVANQGTENEVFENTVPLVRLTQMLGGVPPVEVSFTPKVVREQGKAPRTIYVPVNDPEKRRRHEMLTNRYRLNGKAPSSILIITARSDSYRDKDDFGNVWDAHRESDSSEFWKRNHYASICRFAVYDFAKEGPVQADADEFGFWTSVLLLAANDPDPSIMQAYRVYSVKPRFDKEKMSAAFQAMANRLRDARSTIERSIQREVADDAVGEMLPNYRMNVTVPVQVPGASDYSISRRAYPLTSESVNSEIALWDSKCAEAEGKLAKAVRTAQRVLDQTSYRIRGSYSFTEDEVSPLGRYQEEDLTRETDEIYSDIISLQGQLPTQELADRDGAKAAANVVKHFLRTRVPHNAAWKSVILISALVMVFGLAPGIVDTIARHGDIASFIYSGCLILLAVLAVIAGTTLTVLLWQKHSLAKLINHYNQFLRQDFQKLVMSADIYSKYLSQIVSHSRGVSYLHHSSHLKSRHDSIHEMKYRHIRTINALLKRLQKWGAAYYIPLDMTSHRIGDWVNIDYSSSPESNRLYSLGDEHSHSVEINRSGMQLDSPVDFVCRLEIEREEFYDNNR